MLSQLINRVTEYLKIKVQLIKLEIISHSAKFLSHVIVVGFLIVFCLFLMFFLSFGLSAYFNEFFESNYLGYLLVGGLHFLSLLLLILLTKMGSIQKWLEAVIVKAVDKNEESE